MTAQVDFFGKPPEPKHGKHYIRAVGYVNPPGTGPKGETCKTCAHRAVHPSKRFSKCGLNKGKWTHSRRTDILAKSPACSSWQTLSETNGDPK